MRNHVQLSESIPVISLLAVTGGFLESYSFICRDQVFANCQTGNLVLLAMYFSQRDFFQAFTYTIPVIAFIIGILLTNFIRDTISQKFLHWRQITVCLEIILMLLVGFIPCGPRNIVATTMIAFSCSIQVETFRKVKGTGCATTMCTGNLRSAVDFLYRFFIRKEKSALSQSSRFLTIIAMFLGGAIAGGFCTNFFSYRAVWFTLIMLVIVFCLMFSRPDDEAR